MISFNNNKLANILGLIIGIGMIVTNIWIFFGRAELMKHGLEVPAVVTEVNRGKHKSVYVDYTINNITYHNRLRIVVSNTSIGEELVILYKPNNPDKITLKDRERALDDNGTLIIYVLIGVLLIILSLDLEWIRIKKTGI